MLTRHPQEKPFCGYKASTIIWALAFSMSLPPLFGFSYYHPDPSGFTWVLEDVIPFSPFNAAFLKHRPCNYHKYCSYRCAPVWSDKEGKGYHWYLLVCGFFIPHLLMTTAYINIVYQQKKVPDGILLKLKLICCIEACKIVIHTVVWN